MEIEVGEYVRSKDGYIGKVQKITYDNIGKCNYYICEKNNVMASNYSENITKHSKNIIDLVEIDDYVNGYKVVHIAGHYISVESSYNYDLCFEEQDIKSIITHEQFKSIEYKVEEGK